MTLAQVQAAVAVVAALVITWAGLLVSVALLMPAHTGRAEKALAMNPKRCFLSGLGVLAVFILSIIGFQLPNPVTKLVTFLLLLMAGAVFAVGAAGLAQLMGTRIAEMSGAKTSFGMVVRGCLAYSMGAFFPYLGWFLFLPISLVFALGAGAVAFWPKRRTSAAPTVPPLPDMQGAS